MFRFKSKAAAVPPSSESVHLGSSFSALTLPIAGCSAVLQAHSQGTASAEQQQPLLRDGENLCPAVTLTPSANHTP